MSLNTDTGHWLTLPEVARVLPRRGGKAVSVRTVWRYIRRGLSGVVLPSEYIAGRRMVAMSALHEWCRQVAAAHGATEPSVLIEQSIELAEARAYLSRFGYAFRNRLEDRDCPQWRNSATCQDAVTSPRSAACAERVTADSEG